MRYATFEALCCDANCLHLQSFSVPQIYWQARDCAGRLQAVDIRTQEALVALVALVSAGCGRHDVIALGGCSGLNQRYEAARQVVRQRHTREEPREGEGLLGSRLFQD